MGNSQKKENKPINYYCKKCGEIPLMHFYKFCFDCICSKHKILNIPIDNIDSYISFEHECFVCLKSSKNNDLYYCYNCSKNYCNECINEHNKQEDNKSHFLVDILQKNAICKLHYKNYNKFCLKCKLNLCELCESHNDHNVEFFQDIYPLDEDIKLFNDNISMIYRYIREEKEKKILRKCVQNKIIFIETFSKNTSNYYHINNFNLFVFVFG
jgi:hypothetical protein